MRLLGAVLAGGRSSRFGSDKALALLGGKPLIEHVIAALGAQADAVILCGRQGADWGIDGVPDRPAADLGPLGGINAALHCAAARGYDAVLTAPCDMPVLPPNLPVTLAGGGHVANVPVVGLWPVQFAEGLDEWLAGAGDRSVRRWARQAGLAAIPLAFDFPNLNTPADLDRFR